MKPFDLQRALAGDKVVTRDGREVTQLTKFDAHNVKYSVIGVLDGVLLSWNDIGEFIEGLGRGNDLFMAPKTVKRWVNFYDNSTDSYASETAAKNMAFPTIAIAIAVPVEFEEGYGCE